jgi:hypothetical protein
MCIYVYIYTYIMQKLYAHACTNIGGFDNDFSATSQLPNKENVAQNTSIKDIILDRPSHWGENYTSLYRYMSTCLYVQIYACISVCRCVV